MIAKETVRLNDGSFVLFEAINATVVKVKTNCKELLVFHKIVRRKKIITRIVLNGGELVLLDKTLLDFNITPTFTARYNTIALHTGEEEKIFLYQTAKRTICSYFVPPLINGSRSTISWDRYFVNAYIVEFTEEQEFSKLLLDGKYAVGILARFFPTESFYNLEERLTMLGCIMNVNWDTDHILFIMPITREGLSYEERKARYHNFEMILKSRYSLFTSAYKEKILKFHNFAEDGEMAQILHKHPSRRKQLELELNVNYIGLDVELLEGIDLSKEVVVITDNKIVNKETLI